MSKNLGKERIPRWVTELIVLMGFFAVACILILSGIGTMTEPIYKSNTQISGIFGAFAGSIASVLILKLAIDETSDRLWIFIAAVVVWFIVTAAVYIGSLQVINLYYQNNVMVNAMLSAVIAFAVIFPLYLWRFGWNFPWNGKMIGAKPTERAS